MFFLIGYWWSQSFKILLLSIGYKQIFNKHKPS
jgi:hypothetical protein